MDSFVINALIAGIALALVAGPLGSVVVWRQMAYFGDTLAHSALLGVALAISLELLPFFGVLLVSILLAILLYYLEKRPDLSTDTLLGILSHSTLALGLIIFSLLQGQGYNINVMAYLLGDLLSVNTKDVVLMLIAVVVILAIFSQIYDALVSICTHQDLAQIDGVNVATTRFIFMVLLALVIAVALKVVGILLVTALLIIPSATARLFSKSPKQMIFLSTLVACISVILGISLSFTLDLVTGPAIVVCATLLFFATRLTVKIYS